MNTTMQRLVLVCLLVTISWTTAQENIDDLISQVFGKDPATNPGNPTDPVTQPPVKGVTRQIVEEQDDCKCVPYYLCQNGTINTDGSGLLDIRLKPNACQEYMDICCKDPLDEEHPLKPIPIKRKGCGQRHPDGVGFKITGDKNNEAQFGEFPWMVALLKKTILDNGKEELLVYQCGGALIHEQLVLTAAHCVAPTNDDTQLIARGGEWDTQTTTEVYPHQTRIVQKIAVHPGFKKGNLHNDFALLLLDKPMILGENVGTICLPNTQEVPLSRECYATGWGRNEFGDTGAYQVILKKIDLPIVPKKQCIDLLRNTRLGPFYKLHDSFVCAGGVVGKDTCKGDGGSPLACPSQTNPGSYEVTGLVSWGIGCGTETPGVYAGVAYARSWIDGELRKLGIQLE